MRRSQASTEFVVLTAFMIFFFIIMTIAIQNTLLSAQLDRNERLAKQLANLINEEALLASEVNDGYERTFFLPPRLDGSPYSLTLTNGQDLAVGFRGQSYLFFLDAELTTTALLRPGENTAVN